MPFWTGVINGLGHHLGYRNFDTRDASHNIVPLAVVTAGEALHNNHHRSPRSACFAVRPWELDMGWWVIRLLAVLGLARDIWLPERRFDSKRTALAGALGSKEP
jgi:stearoyl-CoA desaturase (delta-9 desaturase)